MSDYVRHVSTWHWRQPKVPTGMARLRKVARHSSHKASATLSPGGKALAINKDVFRPFNNYKSRVVLLNRSHMILMLVSSP
jgi:hypothetical protein